MTKKEKGRKKQAKDAGIFLLVDPAAEMAMENYIRETMERLFPEVGYVGVFFENGDNLSAYLKQGQPQVFIFDAERVFVRNSSRYKATELLYRMLRQFPKAKGVLMTTECLCGRSETPHCEATPDKVFPEKVIWFKKLTQKAHSGRISVEYILKKVFG